MNPSITEIALSLLIQTAPIAAEIEYAAISPTAASPQLVSAMNDAPMVLAQALPVPQPKPDSNPPKPTPRDPGDIGGTDPDGDIDNDRDDDRDQDSDDDMDPTTDTDSGNNPSFGRYR